MRYTAHKVSVLKKDLFASSLSKNKSTRDNSISPDSKLNCQKGITQPTLTFQRAEQLSLHLVPYFSV